MDKIEILRELLKNELPIHDTPIGKLHPYWARKPFNIIETIINTLSSTDDLILDPFMGSGTTLFAAAKHHRRVIGADINPLSVFIVESTLALSSLSGKIISKINEFISLAEIDLMPLFKIGELDFIERSRYEVIGEFEKGHFKLKPGEIITKQFVNGKWSKRKVSNNKIEPPIPINLKAFNNYPLDFSKLLLTPNSRIAIPQGSDLSHYFSEKNIICINYLLEQIKKSKFAPEEKRILHFLLSSSIPLLRLSDKKASSQWPYWRPKQELTSRNPLIVLRKRISAFSEALEWMQIENINKSFSRLSYKKVYTGETISFGRIPIQRLSEVISEKPSLIITDPPYSDHVPYLEYSAMWNHIFNLKIVGNDFLNEIVNTDAPSRVADKRDYSNRLSESLKICSELIKDNGLIVWFYQDQSLQNWKYLYDTSLKENLKIIDIIPLNKQRRSMKTITTPGKTLDGDLILIFQKKIGVSEFVATKNKIPKVAGQTYYSQYTEIIQNAMINGGIEKLAGKFKLVDEIIE